MIDGRYEILDALGSGGMGQVYRARRIRLGDEVAIKVMQATPDAPPESRERFLRESRACAQLRHPEHRRPPRLRLRRRQSAVHGDGAAERAEPARGDRSRGADVAGARRRDSRRRWPRALQLAHDRGITHRDLKPANIVAHRYESGERVYKVIDFGLAAMKATSDETRLTDPAFFLGTLAYAAPEQMRGEDVTPGDRCLRARRDRLRDADRRPARSMPPTRRR